MKEFMIMCTVVIMALLFVTSMEIIERLENTVGIERITHHLKANDKQISGMQDYINELEYRIEEIEGVVFEGAAK
jgi:archaellum component FlaC